MTIPKAFLFTALLVAIEVAIYLGFEVLLNPITVNFLKGDYLEHYYRFSGELPFVLAYILMFLIFFRSDFGRAKGTEHLRGLNFRILSYIVILAIGLEFLDRPFFDFSKIVDSFNGMEVQFTQYSSRDMSIYRIISLVLLGPVFEELFFRKMVFGRLYNKYSLNVSILVSSVCFSLIHLPGYRNLLPTFIFGIVSCLVYHKTHSILYSILLHVLANLSLVLLSIYGEGFYDWIFSLKFSFIYWVVFLVGFAMTFFGLRKITSAKVYNKA
ncbi:CPBP family intramembrane glutamic endopeptidase [Robertkochia sediminum]|uniref:CPBP family intramembrane glutamic endopeptidase n=1 Tax=Robertkochia sediminum TaxID=2785326 RepID=UPI001931BC37|nr:CPBP family intramembrane glutamic endopeptidase [Robertkochia sediminum]MBL7472076.1 CPBP family intramembrane metalloprotease [Robertkochia sediminum]